jgi:hypothetical protein
MNTKQRRQEERKQAKQREKQRKEALKYFDEHNIPYLDDGTVVEEVEIVDELEYIKEPKNHQPFFRDPLKDFPDEIFNLGFERPVIFEGEFEVISIDE